MKSEPVIQLRNNPNLWTRLLRQKELQLMVLPGIAILILFKTIRKYKF